MTQILAEGVAAFSAVVLLSGCVPQPAVTQLPDRVPAASVGISDVTWRLVEFQSMDDAQGVTRPDDRDKYTMSLTPDGRAAFRLDCNRAMGSWTSEPAQDGASGSIHFSRLAVTKALCPPPSMGERLERDIMYMRGYLLRDGRLNLSLMADAGIYVWEPSPPVK